MEKVVIYSRVSTQDQNYISQFEDLKKYANANSYNVIKCFGEKVSGYDQTVERTEYENMKSFVVKNNIKLILIWELSRLGRSSLQTLNEINYFTKLGINIFFKKENLYTITDNVINNLLINLLSSIAEMERTTINERATRGRISSAEKGKRVNLPVMPYGYKEENHYIKIDEEEAKVIEQIYSEAILGISLRQICNKLNSQNILTRQTSLGKKRLLRNGTEIKILWRPGTIRKILKNTLYKGERKYRNLIIPVPAIITSDTYNKVQERLANHIGYINRTKYPYLFKSKIYCGHCGLMYSGRTDTRYKILQSRYLCTGASDKGIKCKAGTFNTQRFDNFIYNGILLSGNLIKPIIEENQKNFNENDKRDQINWFTNQLVSKEERWKRCINLYKNGNIDQKELLFEENRYKSEKIAIELQRKKLEKEIENYKGTDVLKQILAMVGETNFDIKREFVNKYIERIVIYKVDKTTNKIYSEVHGQNKIIYIEIFAFGNTKPIKAVMASRGDSFSEKSIQFNKVTNFLK